MSMECDTRLAMMALSDRTHQRSAPRRTSRVRRMSASAAATSAAALASLALTLFTRGA